MNNRYSTCHSVIGYRMYNRSLFPYRLRMRVSCPEAGVNVPTFSRFRIFFTLVLSPRGVTDAQAPCEGIPLGRYARPNYTVLLETTSITCVVWVLQHAATVVVCFGVLQCCSGTAVVHAVLDTLARCWSCKLPAQLL